MSNFPGFLYFVPNILSRIVEGDQEEIADLSSMPLLWDDEEEEVKEGKELKILTLNKLLMRLPVLLAKIEARNNSYKLENKIRQIVYLQYQHNKITKELYNNLIKSL